MIKEQAESLGFLTLPSQAMFLHHAMIRSCDGLPECKLVVLAPYYSGLQWAKQTGERFHVVRSGYGLSSFLFPNVPYEDDKTRRHKEMQDHDFF